MKKRPGTRPGRRSSKLFFWAYFVAGAFGVGAGDVAGAASVVFVVSFVGPPFLCDFFLVFAPVEEAVEASVEDFSVVAPVTGFVIVLASALVVVLVSSAKATPSDRRATATRAGRVFFIFFSIPLFLWPVRGLPTGFSAQPLCHARDRRRAKAISCFS